MSEAVKPIVAIVGRPNVGKSRLFNRFLQSARSIVADQPGVTRDRIYADAELIGPNGPIEIVLVDTGGFDPKTNDPIVQARSRENKLPIVFVHPAEFLVTDPAGEIRARTILGDRLEIDTTDVGGERDRNEVFFFDVNLTKSAE